jgi:hypothetical protein
MVADESDPMIDAGSIGDIHNRESTPYLLCGHTKNYSRTFRNRLRLWAAVIVGTHRGFRFVHAW